MKLENALRNIVAEARSNASGRNAYRGLIERLAANAYVAGSYAHTPAQKRAVQNALAQLNAMNGFGNYRPPPGRSLARSAPISRSRRAAPARSVSRSRSVSRRRATRRPPPRRAAPARRRVPASLSRVFSIHRF